MPVDQNNWVELAEAKLALEITKDIRFQIASYGSISTGGLTAITIISFFISDYKAIPVVIAFLAGAVAMFSLTCLRKENANVRKQKKRVKELSGD